MIGVVHPTLVLGWREIAVFMLANAIIFWICFGKLWVDIKRWRQGK